MQKNVLVDAGRPSVDNAAGSVETVNYLQESTGGVWVVVENTARSHVVDE